MALKADILLKVELKHQFFQDGCVRGMNMIPTATGERQMSGFRGHLHTYDGGIAIFYPASTDSTESTTPTRIPKYLNIAFALEQTDPDFLNFTDLAEMPAGSVLYYNNLPPAQSPLNFKQMELRGGQFTLDFSGQMPTERSAKRIITISRANGQVVFQNTYYTTPGDARCNVNLLNETDGAYIVSFTIGDTVLTRSFFKYGGNNPLGIIGFFEWFSSLDATGTPETIGKEFKIEFNARETYWQYYLVRKNGISLKNPHISPVEMGGKTIQFTITNQDVVLPDGLHAVEFSSDSPLPLQEAPQMEIMLEASGLAKGMQLPYASPDLLYSAQSAQEQSSRIYVYF